MSITDSIKKAYFDFEKLMLDTPKVVRMSELTLRDVITECNRDFIVCSRPAVEMIYGMTIITDNRLPKGLVVVGGVVCSVSEGAV